MANQNQPQQTQQMTLTMQDIQDMFNQALRQAGQQVFPQQQQVPQQQQQQVPQQNTYQQQTQQPLNGYVYAQPAQPMVFQQQQPMAQQQPVVYQQTQQQPVAYQQTQQPVIVPQTQPIVIYPQQQQQQQQPQQMMFTDPNTGVTYVAQLIAQNGGNPAVLNGISPQLQQTMVGYACCGNGAVTQSQYNTMLCGEIQDLKNTIANMEYRSNQKSSKTKKIVKYVGGGLVVLTVVSGVGYAIHEATKSGKEQSKFDTTVGLIRDGMNLHYGKDI